MFKRMLVCYDGSASFKKALHAAVMLAQEHGAVLCCLLVEEGLPTYAGTIDEFQEVKTVRQRRLTLSVQVASPTKKGSTCARTLPAVRARSTRGTWPPSRAAAKPPSQAHCPHEVLRAQGSGR